MDIRNFFNEESERFEERFSSMVIVAFAYYVIGYYILEVKERCKKLVDWKTLGIIIVFHIIQVSLAFKYWSEGNILYSWLFILVPLLIFVACKQYMSSYKKQTYMRMKAYMQKRKGKRGQMFGQDTTPTGMQNEMIRNQQGRTVPDDLYGIPPQELARTQMDNIMNSGNVPAYGDYVNEYDPEHNQQILYQNIDPARKMYSTF